MTETFSDEFINVGYAQSKFARVNRWEQIGNIARIIKTCCPHKEQIIQLRQADESQREQIKLNITANHPVILYNGLVLEGEAKDGACAMSGFMFFDCDQIMNSDQIAFAESFPYTVLRNMSLRGQGQHIVIAVSFPDIIDDYMDKSLWSRAYNWVKDNYMNFAVFDEQCCNINRLTFISHDPNAYYNPNFSRLDIPWNELKQKKSEESENNNFRREKIDCPVISNSKLQSAFETLSQAGFEEVDERDVYLRFVIICAREGIDKEACWELCTQNPKYDTKANRRDFDGIWNGADRYEQLTGGTLIHWAKKKDDVLFDKILSDKLKKNLVSVDRIDALRSGKYFHFENINFVIDQMQDSPKMPILVAPTGTGKTTAIKKYAEANPDKKIGVLTQYRITRDNFRSLMGDIKNITVTYAQSLGQNDGEFVLDDRFRKEFDQGDYDVVFIDEIHKLMTEDFRRVNNSAISNLLKARQDGRMIVGMTATPDSLVFCDELFKIVEFGGLPIQRRPLTMMYHKKSSDKVFLAKICEQLCFDRRGIAKINNVQKGMDMKKKLKELFPDKRINVICGELNHNKLDQDDKNIKDLIKKDQYDGNCDLIFATETLQEAVSFHNSFDFVIMSNEYSDTAIKQLAARERDNLTDVFCIYKISRSDRAARTYAWLHEKAKRIKTRFYEQTKVEEQKLGDDRNWERVDELFHEAIRIVANDIQFKWTEMFKMISKKIKVFNAGNRDEFICKLSEYFDILTVEMDADEVEFDTTDNKRDKLVRVMRGVLESDEKIVASVYDNDRYEVGKKLITLIASGMNPTDVLERCKSARQLTDTIKKAEVILLAKGQISVGNHSTQEQVMEMSDRFTAIDKTQRYTMEELKRICKYLVPELHENAENDWQYKLASTFMSMKKCQIREGDTRKCVYIVESTFNEWKENTLNWNATSKYLKENVLNDNTVRNMIFVKGLMELKG